jgi:hypothetical protein
MTWKSPASDVLSNHLASSGIQIALIECCGRTQHELSPFGRKHQRYGNEQHEANKDQDDLTSKSPLCVQLLRTRRTESPQTKVTPDGGRLGSGKRRQSY